MKLVKASYKAIKYACLNFHYAKTVPVNVFGYSVFNDKNEWCGVIVYGHGSNNNIAKPFGLKIGEVLELVRVALNGKQEFTSKAVAMSLKLIKKDIPLCKLVVSYADLDQNHIGTIYQATNWYFVGIKMENKKDGSYIINGKRVHGRTISAKFKKYGLSATIENIKKFYKTDDVEAYITKGKVKYLYPLCDEMRQLCEKLKQDYIKKSSISI
jgi:hypothetical protein